MIALKCSALPVVVQLAIGLLGSHEGEREHLAEHGERPVRRSARRSECGWTPMLAPPLF